MHTFDRGARPPGRRRDVPALLRAAMVIYTYIYIYTDVCVYIYIYIYIHMSIFCFCTSGIRPRSSAKRPAAMTERSDLVREGRGGVLYYVYIYIYIYDIMQC